ncbi:hypothetical protein DWU89_09275 [Parabacteroides acidifaciens]|nr:hypothetical protein [Parabacteroides acidifaciens]RDU49435.1 hypothetical protein DWU89_09275 [Parabacteroides acidifaciens]
MKKLHIFLIVLPLLLSPACHKVDYTTVGSFKFEKEVINLDSRQQEVEVKANRDHWQMAVGDENGNRVEGDTINMKWYTLIKKDKGASLLIKVSSNNGEERSFAIGFRSSDLYIGMIVNQKGIE